MSDPSVARINTGKPWTDWELDYMRYELHRGTSVVEIAEYLQRDGNEVDAKADFMGM
jgi:hypothetical protein